MIKSLVCQDDMTFQTKVRIRWGLLGTHMHQEYITTFFHSILPWMGLIQTERQQNIRRCWHPLGNTASFKKLHSGWKNHLVDEKCLNLWMVRGVFWGLRSASILYLMVLLASSCQLAKQKCWPDSLTKRQNTRKVKQVIVYSYLLVSIVLFYFKAIWCL